MQDLISEPSNIAGVSSTGTLGLEVVQQFWEHKTPELHGSPFVKQDRLGWKLRCLAETAGVKAFLKPIRSMLP